MDTAKHSIAPLLVLLALLLAGCGGGDDSIQPTQADASLGSTQNAPAQAEGGFHFFTYGDEPRSFFVYIPPSLQGSTEPAPLLIALHPNSSSGLAMEALTGFDVLADEHGFIVVYPNSLGYYWGEDARYSDTPDDLGFIGALVDYMLANYLVDAERVHVAGFMEGGMLAYRLACVMPERFASIAAVGVQMMSYLSDSCPDTATSPVGVLTINGSANHLARPETYQYSDGTTILGIADTLAFWAERSHCAAESLRTDANIYVYDSCDGDVIVAHYNVLGGGYNWPRIGDYQLNQFGVDVSQMIGKFFAGDADWAIPQPAPFVGTPRSYVVYVPSYYVPEEPMPVVMMLHGFSGSGVGTAAFTDMNRFAEEYGFIGLYPNSIDSYSAHEEQRGWNYASGTPLAVFPPGAEYDDVAFLSALIDDLAVDLNIDRQRVYVGGFSNGGFMVQRLACAAPDVFAAFADVAGSGFLGMPEMCQTDTPVALLMIHGTEDDDIPWDGLLEEVGGEEVYTTLPILDVIDFWSNHNGCVGEPDIVDIPPLGVVTSVQVSPYAECLGNSEVVLYTVTGGGHTWPGIPDSHGRPVNLDIHASEVLWEFFSYHSLDGGN